MFPEESTDVHISSSSTSLSSSSSTTTPLPISIKFNAIPISIPIQSSLLSSTKSTKNLQQQQQQNISEITSTGSAQAVVADIVIDIPILSNTKSESITAATTIEGITSKSIQSIKSLSSVASVTESSSSTSSLSETITIDRIINRNENEKEFKKYNNASSSSSASASSSSSHYKCIPPPLFVILVSVIEIAVFLYESWILKHQENYNNEINGGIPIPSDSILVYRPDKRQEIWRFFSYMVLHANWFHLSFNIIVQLIFGIPLEIVHGSIRIGCIYLAGVFAGSLGTSVVDSKVYLVGASGGVYALLGSHLANILLNYKQIKYCTIKLLSILIFGLCDIGFAIYTRYFDDNNINNNNINDIINLNININDDNSITSIINNNSMPPISYVAHLSGALAGLTIGLLVLKNFQLNKNHNNEQIKSHRHLLWWTALGIYMAFIIFTITFNIMNTMTAQILEEKGQVIKQYLFHNLGGSS